MMGTILDAVASLYVGAGAWQGHKRKLSGELGRLVGVGVAFLLGCGAFKGLEHLTEAGHLGFFGAFAGGAVGVKVIRRTLARKGRHATRHFLDRTISEKTDRRFGMVAGGVRSLILAAVGVGAAYLVPSQSLHQTLYHDSALGKAVGTFIRQGEAP